MKTYSGHFSLSDPQPEDVDIGDIIHSLSRICRFNGHCRHFYSVAQHSYLTSYLVKEHKYEALLHNAGEAYYGNIPRPVLEQIIGDAWFKITAKIDKVIAVALDLEYPLPDEVVDADDKMLATEIRDLFFEAGMSIEAAKFTIIPLETRIIEPIFGEEIYAHFHNHQA